MALYLVCNFVAIFLIWKKSPFELRRSENDMVPYEEVNEEEEEKIEEEAEEDE